MTQKFMQTVLTSDVQRAQDTYFGRHQTVFAGKKLDSLTSDEIAFIAARDSFYMATVNSDGWPYIQHRGGPAGFLKVLDPQTLGFADFKGNRQLLSTGNLVANNRVALFLMDYPNHTRLKILGHARVVAASDNEELTDKLTPSIDLRGKVERLFLINMVGFDWNCPQYITPRHTEEEVREAVAPLRQRIAELEAKLDASVQAR
jgi:predicted pyridoxine 5'-phosphate oxidase superfamily flavin-nucleotide-binding protein